MLLFCCLCRNFDVAVFLGGTLWGAVLTDTIFFEEIYVELLLSKCLGDEIFEKL